MSDAKASAADIFSIALCSQCQQPFPPSTTRDVRHAVPCGHVFCKDCLGRVEAEQKSGKSVCRRAGCERELAPASDFAPSWVAQRAERIKATQRGMFPDQGNVGDRPPPTCSECDPDTDTGKPHLATHQCKTCGDGVFYCSVVAAAHPKLKSSKGHVVVALAAASAPKADAEPARELCAQHKLPFRVVEASTHRPMCSECLVEARGKVPVETFDEAIAALETADAASISAVLATQKAELAEATFTADELRARITKWGGEETARIRAWEEREVNHVRAVASETVQLVQEVCARRIEVGASLITQRMGLRASLEEFDQALADLPSDPAARLSKMQPMHAERKRLCELLARSAIAVPSAHEILKWAELPALSAEFDQKGADNGGVLASAVSAAAKDTLGKARTRLPELPARALEVPARAHEEKAQSAPGSSSPKGVPAFPVIPKLVQSGKDSAEHTDAKTGLRSIPMGGKSPNVFVGLDDGTVVVGLDGMSPLQVWDLAAGKLVREFQGKGKCCSSMANLPGGRIAAGWHNGSQRVVAVFDAVTGKQLQDLTGYGGGIYGLALVEDHLLTMCVHRSFRVWSQDAAGKFTEKAKFATTGDPYGAMTVLSPSTVAMSMDTPAQIEIWDWRTGKCVRTLTGFGGRWVFAHALLPDGRLVAGDWAGVIRVGLVDNWAAATVISNGGSTLISVLAGHDGTFVTTDTDGNIKLWKNGACEVTLTGGCTDAYYGVPLAVIGRRFIALGDIHNLLVAE